MKVSPEAVAAEERRALETGAVVHRRSDFARYRLTGGGRLACLQGLVTCDVSSPDAGVLFGAMLSAKGMILTPLWIFRAEGHFLLEAPARAAPRIDAVFAKSLPPRACRWERVDDDMVGFGVYGPAAAGIVADLTHAQRAAVRGAPGFDVILPVSAADRLSDACRERGVVPASDALMEERRILAGIPRLGAEIDEKTLPQEVRFEELGGVSYTKGCYVGQETVARLHFRGHANRRLALLVLDGEPPAHEEELGVGERNVGRLTSSAWASELDSWVGQAVLRREVSDGDTVSLASGGSAVVNLDRWLLDP